VAQVIAELIADLPKDCSAGDFADPLRIRAEQRYRVSPLALPSTKAFFESIAEAPAVRMFVDRASVSTPQFQLDAGSASTIAAVRRRLDGNPLAIELAAARLALLGPALLMQRLDNAFVLLQRGPTDAPVRQQTLRHTLDWCHTLVRLFDSDNVRLGPAVTTYATCRRCARSRRYQ
jgi:predicted ATPase